VKNQRGRDAADRRSEQKLPFTDSELEKMYEACETKYGKQEVQMVPRNPAFGGNSTGWLLGVWPEVVLYENAGGGADIRGYGVEIGAAAFANSVSCCAERLSRPLAWITELLSRARERTPQTSHSYLNYANSF
jgi:hypothetical protein